MPETKGTKRRFDERHIDIAVLCLIALCFTAFLLHQIVAVDIWWQLKTGQLVRSSGWPQVDPFSYGFPGRAWIEVRWLYCVFISLIYEKLGVGFLVIVKATWMLLAGVALWSFGRREARWVVNVGLLAAVVLIHQRLMIRPELASYMFLALYLLFLRRYPTEGNRLWLYLLLPVQVLWVNSHTLYAIGPVLLWIFLIAEFASGFVPLELIRDSPEKLEPDRLRPLLIATIGVSLACLINPYGVRGALFAAEIFSEIQSDHVIGSLISELRSPFAVIDLRLLFVAYIFVIGLSAAGFVLRRKSLSPGWLAVWGAFLYLSVLAERNVALFGIVAAAAIIINFGRITLSPRIVLVARLACAGFCIVMIPLVVSNYYYRSIDPYRKFGLQVSELRFPVKALEFIDSQGLPKPVFTSINEASYPLFRYGAGSVYIDGRLEVYGGDNVYDAIKMFSSGENLLPTLERLNVSTLVAQIENDAGLVQNLLRDPAWTAVYFDEAHIVFLRNSPATQALADKLKVDWKDPQPRSVEMPSEFRSGEWLSKIFPSVGDSVPSRILGELFIAAGNLEKGQQYLVEAVKQWPDDTRAAMLLGVYYRAQKRDAEAAKLLARVPQSMLDQRDTLVFAANTYESFGNMPAATDAWVKLSAIDQSRPVYQHVVKTATAAGRWEAAYTALNAIGRTTPNDIEVLNTLGIVADKLNRKAEAIKAFERSLQLNPSQPPVLTGLGVIKLESGDAAGARQAFEKALAIDPSFSAAREQLDRLK